MSGTILTADQLAALHTELQKPAYAALTDSQRMDALHAPSSVPNPTPQSQVSVPFDESDLFSVLSQATMQSLEASPALPAIVSDINTGNATAVGTWANFFVAAGRMQASERDAIVARLSQTEADPSWAATLATGPSPKQALFGAATWQYPDGRTIDFIPLPDVAASR